MEKEKEKFLIKSVHAEPDAPTDKEVASKIPEKIGQLGEFLRGKVAYTVPVPAAWKSALR